MRTLGQSPGVGGPAAPSRVISQGQKPLACLWLPSLEKRELIFNPSVKGAREHTLILPLTSPSLSGEGL